MARRTRNPLKKKQEQVEKNRDKTVETTKEVNSFIVREQAILFNVVGLKPNTRHYFYFDNVDNSSKCAPLAGKKGDSLISDKNGKITSFTFFYDADIDASTDRQKVVSEINRIAGVKEIRIESSDGVSIATHQITIKVNTSNDKPYFTVGGIGGVGVGGVGGVGGAGF